MSESFFKVLTAAVLDVQEHGYDSQQRINDWLHRLRAAMVGSMASQAHMEAVLQGQLANIYTRLIEKEGWMRLHKGVGRMTIDHIKPHLRAELERRMRMSAELIRLNRERMISQTEQRFAGWASSIPPGGSQVVERTAVKAEVRKALAQLPFEERRVAIDQGHKLAADLNNIIATDGGAIAAEWHSHWRQPGYNYRPDHKERDGHVYLIRDSWAIKKGLVKMGSATYTDEITRPGEEVFCRCAYTFLYNPRDLPDSMLTRAGRDFAKR